MSRLTASLNIELQRLNIRILTSEFEIINGLKLITNVHYLYKCMKFLTSQHLIGGFRYDTTGVIAYFSRHFVKHLCL